MTGFITAKRAKINKPKDSVGGFIRPSGVYKAVVEMAYGQNSESSDSQAMVLQFKLEDGSKLYSKLWMVGSDGNVFSEKTPGVKKYRKDYLLADALASFATDGEEDLFSLETEELKIQVTRDSKKVNTVVDSFFDLVGLEVQLGLIATERYKQNFVDGKYDETDEIIVDSKIDAIFDEEGFTLNELENEDGPDTPTFIEEWKKVWTGKTRKVAPKKEEKGLRKNTSSTGSNAKSRVQARKALPRRK